jgi:predicted phosphodiesterase
VISNDKILAQAIFQTGKTAEQPFKFAVFGDSGSGKTSQYEVAAQIEKHRVDFILHTGDIVYPSGEDEFYRARFYQPYKDILARIPIFPVLGNHDYETDDGKPWVNNFCLPGEERYYSFDYANAHFIALDSYRIDAKSAAWLERDLKRAAKLWKVVVFHEPPFSNKSGRTGSAGARRLWLPLFEKYKVDLVFSGHDHMYTRFKPRGGVIYIVEGLGGNSMNKINRDAGHVEFTDNTRFGFGLVEVAGRKLIFRHITADGAVLDTLTLVKPAPVAAPTG